MCEGPSIWNKSLSIVSCCPLVECLAPRFLSSALTYINKCINASSHEYFSLWPGGRQHQRNTNVICFREIIKRNKSLPHAPDWLLCFLKVDFILTPLFLSFFFFFYIFFSQQSLVWKLQLREHGSSRSPAGTEQQSQDKQVPVLRLFSVWKALWSKLNSPPPFWGVHGKYIIWFSLTRFHLNTINLKKMWKTGYFSGFFLCLCCRRLAHPAWDGRQTAPILAAASNKCYF